MTYGQITTLTVAAMHSSGSAFAHAVSDAPRPVDGASVDALVLTFNEPLRVTTIDLAGPDSDLEVVRETGVDLVTAFAAVAVILSATATLTAVTTPPVNL